MPATNLTEKIERRRERAKRKAARAASYGKRSARVRRENLQRRADYVGRVIASPTEIAAFAGGRQDVRLRGESK